MIQIKICGITNIDDALCVAECGAAAVGFIFYPPSLRYIQPNKARMIVDKLPRELVKVGVFVNETAAEVKRIFDYCGLDMLQFHGDETPDYCRQFPSMYVIKALELKNEEDVRSASCYDAAAILADSRRAGLYGGTGKITDWDLAGRIAQRLILSGGLNEDNIMKALQKVNPAALDINSGIEERPGKKDSAKIARIMQMIKTGDAGGHRPLIFVKRKET
jgi:phosphoribosylanthranilate isomerase